MNEKLLRETRMLDFSNPAIQRLVKRARFGDLDEAARIGAIYAYVRDEIGFGYNAADDIPASRVLEDGYGQCNTKSTLLMALLRACGVPCRFHGFTVAKELQAGIVTGLSYALAPSEILHSWVEVWNASRWIALEGVILDTEYLNGLRTLLPDGTTAWLGHGVGTEDLTRPAIDWRGEDTFIQRTGIRQDFGLFDDPDAFYAKHGVNLSGLKRLLFVHWVRHRMNAKVKGIRGCPTACARRPATLARSGRG